MTKPAIEGAFRVIGDRPKREPVIKSWWGFVALGVTISANYFVRYGLWELSKLLSRH